MDSLCCNKQSTVMSIRDPSLSSVCSGTSNRISSPSQNRNRESFKWQWIVLLAHNSNFYIINLTCRLHFVHSSFPMLVRANLPFQVTNTLDVHQRHTLSLASFSFYWGKKSSTDYVAPSCFISNTHTGLLSQLQVVNMLNELYSWDLNAFPGQQQQKSKNIHTSAPTQINLQPYNAAHDNI